MSDLYIDRTFTNKHIIQFEVAKGFEDKDINLPKRSTKTAVGYDFEVAETVTIDPHDKPYYDKDDQLRFASKPTLVKTGIKAKFPDYVGLFLYNRSSNPGKLGLMLANGTGVVESDYYGNPDNDGHIMFAFWNLSDKPVTLEKGQRIGQGVFQPFMTVTDDDATGERLGGFGSTGR